MIASSHPLDVATRLERQGEGRFIGRTPPQYANMVGPFGGIIAATLLATSRQIVY